MKTHRFTVFLGVAVFLFMAYKLIVFTGIFATEDPRASVIDKIDSERIVEGAFLDSSGDVIFAPTKPYQHDETPIPVEYSYLLGYNDDIYGADGLRRTYAEHLYADDETGTGGSIQLTIDSVLQKKAYATLSNKDYSGSIIIMDAKNAEILAMAERVEEDYVILRPTAAQKKDDKGNEKSFFTWHTEWSVDWQEKYKHYNSISEFWINPATETHNPPGSVFKILTSSAAIMNGMEDYTFDDKGILSVDGANIHNEGNKAYGLETLSSAFIHSTNTYFGSLGLELGEGAMGDIHSRFLVGENIDLGFARLKSTSDFNGSDFNLALMSFGQGNVALSPLHIAMIGQAVINDGNMLKPTVVKALFDAKGKCIFRNNEHELLAQPIKPDIAQKVKDLMFGLTDAVEEDRGYKWTEEYTDKIYMKTGTAQIGDKGNNYHAYLLTATEDYIILITVNKSKTEGKDLIPIADKFLKELY